MDKELQIKEAQQLGQQYPGWYIQQGIEGSKEIYIFKNKEKHVQTFTHPKYLRDQDIQLLINNKNKKDVPMVTEGNTLQQSQTLSEQYQQNASALAEEEEDHKIEEQVLQKDILRESQNIQQNLKLQQDQDNNQDVEQIENINDMINNQIKNINQKQNLNQDIVLQVKGDNYENKQFQQLQQQFNKIDIENQQQQQNNQNNQKFNLITQKDYEEKNKNNKMNYQNVQMTNKPLFKNEIKLSLVIGIVATACYIYGLLTFILNYGAQSTILAAFIYFLFELYDYQSQMSILRVGKIIGYDYQEADDIQEIINKIYDKGAINNQFQETWEKYVKNISILNPQNFKVENITQNINAIIVKKKHLKVKFSLSLEFDSEQTEKEYIEYIKSDKNTKDEYKNLITLSKFKKSNKISPYIKDLQDSLYIVPARKGRRNNNIFKILTSPWILLLGLGFPIRLFIAWISDYHLQDIRYKISKV